MREPRTSSFVIIADDNPSDLEMLSGLVSAGGQDVAIANDGGEVLDLVRREVPDLIMLDGVMPRLDGFETCRRLKADPDLKDVPVILSISPGDPEGSAKAFSVGAVDYITKPFRDAEVLARVETQLALRSVTRMLQDRNARLEQEVREHAAARQALLAAACEVERRTEDLRLLNAQLAQELRRRESADMARVTLQEQIIATQRERLRELSTPLIPIIEGILVMPLIGAMDPERAAHVLETALRGAAERGAAHLIIDITGVKSADATVAQMLVQAAMGLKLLGTRAIITGISPEVARTFVQLDLQLPGLVTTSTLQSGVEHAMNVRKGSHPRSEASPQIFREFT